MCVTMYRSLRRIVGEHPLAVDTAIALVIAVLLALISVGGDIRQSSAATAMVTPAALSAIVGLPLAVRRRNPHLALAATLLLTVVAYAVTTPAPPVMLPLAVALYTVGARGRRRDSLIASGATVLVSVVIRLGLAQDDSSLEDLVRDVAWIVGATALGFAVASRRAFVEEFRRRALEAERTREEEAQRRVDEERLRIARDVHDGVAHALASISLQASAASAVIDTDPAGAREALRQIRGASVSALAELRATVGVLRQPTADGLAGPASAPTLEQLTGLADILRAGGIEVSVSRKGGTPNVPSEVGNVAYRILQESLTNVLRHSGARHVDVVVTYERSVLTLSVTDDGAGPQQEGWRGGGYGIKGMRERAEAVGGLLDAGPAAGGGFIVRAELPLGGMA
jgi:signal transduction histidine kinase